MSQPIIIPQAKREEILYLFWHGEVGEDGLRDNRSDVISKKVNVSLESVDRIISESIVEIRNRMRERVGFDPEEPVKIKSKRRPRPKKAPSDKKQVLRFEQNHRQKDYKIIEFKKQAL